jgi:hypothetical protein
VSFEPPLRQRYRRKDGATDEGDGSGNGQGDSALSPHKENCGSYVVYML